MALYELLEGGDSCLLILNQADECLRAIFLPPAGRNSVHSAIHCRLHQEYAIAHIMYFGTGYLGLLLHVTLDMHRQAIWFFPRQLRNDINKICPLTTNNSEEPYFPYPLNH